MLYRWRWFAALVVFVMPYAILRYTGIRLGAIGVLLLAAIAFSTEYIIRSNFRFLEAADDVDDDRRDW